MQVERFRSYLRLLARPHLNNELGRTLDASDIVQQTLLQAHRARHQFRGSSDRELAGWLRQILAHTLAHAARDLHRQKRNVSRQRSLQALLDRSSAQMEAWLVAEQASPGEQVVQNEELLQLAEALDALPTAQSQAVTLHYWQGLSLAETAKRLNRTPAAVAGLLQRGLKKVRQQLQEREAT